MRAYSCLCLPIRNRLLWLPHCAEGRKGEEGWLAFAQQTRSFLRSSVCSVRVWRGVEENSTRGQSKFLFPPLNSDSVRKTIFSSFCYTLTLRAHCPPRLVCVCVCVCVCVRAHAHAPTYTQRCKRQPLCMYLRLCLHRSGDGALRGG